MDFFRPPLFSDKQKRPHSIINMHNDCEFGALYQPLSQRQPDLPFPSTTRLRCHFTRSYTGPVECGTRAEMYQHTSWVTLRIQDATSDHTATSDSIYQSPFFL